jgi:hypothetical protein
MCFSGKKQNKPADPTPAAVNPGPPVQSVIESQAAAPVSQYKPTTTAPAVDPTGAKTVLGA